MYVFIPFCLAFFICLVSSFFLQLLMYVCLSLFMYVVSVFLRPSLIYLCVHFLSYICISLVLSAFCM